MKPVKFKIPMLTVIRKFSVTLLCGLFILYADAQNVENNKSMEEDTVIVRKVLVITFEPKMYMSDSDKDIAKASKLNAKSIVNRFRYALAACVKNQLSSKKYEPTMIWEDTTKNASGDLSFIYSSIGYKYEPIPLETKKSKKGFITKKQEKSEPVIVNSDTKIMNGQVAAYSDESQAKYMATVISNKQLIPKLTEKYGADFFVFINQFEIKNDLSDYAAVEKHTNKRMLNVHYTIFDKSEKCVGGCMASSSFPSTLNDIDMIIKNNMPGISQRMVAGMPTLLDKMIKAEGKE